MLNMLL